MEIIISSEETSNVVSMCGYDNGCGCDSDCYDNCYRD